MPNKIKAPDISIAIVILSPSQIAPHIAPNKGTSNVTNAEGDGPKVTNNRKNITSAKPVQTMPRIIADTHALTLGACSGQR